MKFYYLSSQSPVTNALKIDIYNIFCHFQHYQWYTIVFGASDRWLFGLFFVRAIVKYSNFIPHMHLYVFSG